MKLDYSEYRTPDIRDELSLLKQRAVKAIKYITDNTGNHHLKDIYIGFQNLQTIYIYWHGVALYLYQINKYIDNEYKGEDWLESPDYYDSITKDEFETTSAFERRIKSLKENDKRSINLLKKDLSLLFHKEIKSFLTQHYGKIIKSISLEKNCLINTNTTEYDADTEIFSFETDFYVPEDYFEKTTDSDRPSTTIPEFLVNRFPFKYNLEHTYKGLTHNYCEVKIPIDHAKKVVTNVRKGKYKFFCSFEYECWLDSELADSSDIVEYFYRNLIEIQKETKDFYERMGIQKFEPKINYKKSPKLIDVETGHSYPVIEVNEDDW